MTLPVFQRAGATVIRGGETILRDFNWTVREGEAWAVVGPTGSGKTTLAEALLVPFLVVLAIVAALLPAIAAYRTDVAKWLQGPG